MQWNTLALFSWIGSVDNGFGRENIMLKKVNGRKVEWGCWVFIIFVGIFAEYCQKILR